MVCRYSNDDPRKCDRCGAFLWVAEEGLFCGECGVTMPCTMFMRPPVDEHARPGTEPGERRDVRGRFDQAGL